MGRSGEGPSASSHQRDAVRSLVHISTFWGSVFVALFAIAEARYSLAGALVFLSVTILGWFLYGRGLFLLSAGLICIAMLAVTLWVIIYTGGFHSPIVIWLLCAPLISGLIFDRKWPISFGVAIVVFCTAISIVDHDLVELAEFHVIHHTGMSHAFNVISVLSAVATVLFFSTRHRDALETLVEDSVERERRDPLTGILNRSGFTQKTSHIGQEVTTDGISLLIFDVDNFKGINDTFGHPFGDMVLQVIAQEAKSVLRDGDHIARIGGDEFAAILRTADASQALNIGHRMRERIRKAGTDIDELKEIGIGVSVGVATCQNAATCQAEAMLQLADSALYKAKKSTDGVIVLQFG